MPTSEFPAESFFSRAGLYWKSPTEAKIKPAETLAEGATGASIPVAFAEKVLDAILPARFYRFEFFHFMDGAMQGYDIFMIVVLLATTVFGAWKGMAWQIASLASLVVSYFVSLSLSPKLAPLFGDDPRWNRLLAMFAVYILTSLFIWIIFRMVSNFIDRVKLKEFDRQLGALFGLAKGVLLCVAITLFAVSLLPEPQQKNVLDSQSGHYITVLLDRAPGVMPEELNEAIHPYIHDAQQKLDPDHADHDHDGHSPGIFPAQIPSGEDLKDALPKLPEVFGTEGVEYFQPGPEFKLSEEAQRMKDAAQR